MVKNKQLIYFLSLLYLCSCARKNINENFDNKSLEYYGTGELKSIKYSNNNDLKEKFILFSKQGDTIEYKENFIKYLENIFNYNDYSTHKYYIMNSDGDYWLNEWLTYSRNGEIIPEKSEYIYLEDKMDSINFTTIAGNFYDFNLVLFEHKDSVLTKGDTITSGKCNHLMLSKNLLQNKKILCLLQTKIFIDNGYVSSTRKIYINILQKVECQKRIPPQVRRSIGLQTKT